MSGLSEGSGNGRGESRVDGLMRRVSEGGGGRFEHRTGSSATAGDRAQGG